MAKETGTVVAEATNDDATEDAPKVRKQREPSPFEPTIRVTVSVHESLLADGSDYALASPMDILAAYYKRDETVTVRPVQRARKEGASEDGPISQMVYIAPADHEWPAERTGLRIGADTREKLTALAEKTGLTLDALVDQLLAQAANGEGRAADGE